MYCAFFQHGCSQCEPYPLLLTLGSVRFSCVHKCVTPISIVGISCDAEFSTNLTFVFFKDDRVLEHEICAPRIVGALFGQ